MAKTACDRIEELEDEVHALKQLLLAHVAAFADLDTEATDTAICIAAGQADSCIANGRIHVGMKLGTLIEHIQEVRCA